MLRNPGTRNEKLSELVYIYNSSDSRGELDVPRLVTLRGRARAGARANLRSLHHAPVSAQVVGVLVLLSKKCISSCRNLHLT